MRAIPAEFKRSLYLFDPMLQVRWGEFVEAFVIERKAEFIPDRQRTLLNKRFERLAAWVQDTSRDGWEDTRIAYITAGEEKVSAQRGCRFILATAELDNVIIGYLRNTDIKRYGGAEKMADMLEGHERAEAEKLAKDQEEERVAINKASYEVLNFLERKRQTELARGERDVHYMLHGKRKRSKPILETL